jgi:hypothetical protein
MRRTSRIAILLVSLAALGWAAPARAATLVTVGSFEAPTYVTSDPSDPDRLLVVERAGKVILVEGSQRRVFADLEAWVRCCEGERGLFSIAPAADFSTSGRFYAAYAGEASAGGAVGDFHVDLFRPSLSGGAPLRQPVLTVPRSTRENHYGGQLQLGPDGFLYVSTGDGGGVGDPDENARDLESLLGKLLRIEPRPGQVPSYASPPGNPFGGVPGRDEIWSYGLRNPWRFSFDRLTGDLTIGDVGQDLREEVDFALSPAAGEVGGRGSDYGWSCREGFLAYPGAPPSCAAAAGFVQPVFDYPHEDPGGDTAFGCSIVGGYVVRDFGLGDLYGRYLHTDFCTGELRSLLLSRTTATASGDRSERLFVPKPVSFGEDACGRVYVVSQVGAIFRLQGDLGGGCFVAPPVAPPRPVAVTATPRPRPLVVLQARKRGRRAVKLIVRVLPCNGNAGRPVYINRNGRPFRTRRLDRHCAAGLRVRVRGRTKFRAFFEGQRSQVRKIVLKRRR